MRLPQIRFSKWPSIIGVASVAVLMCVAFTPIRVSALDRRCKANLQAIGLALQGYHSDYGCYPPAYTTDVTGRPMHSWRALVLPYVGEHALYRSYRLEEPWDGPNNARLSARMPAVYECPAHPHRGRSSYAVVVGPGTVFPPVPACVSASQIKDPRASLVVELGGAGIPWLEPRDLKLPERLVIPRGWDELKKAAEDDIDDLHRQGLADQPLHPHGINFLFSPVEVEAWWLFGREAGSMLRSMLTIDGGELWYLDDRY